MNVRGQRLAAFPSSIPHGDVESFMDGADHATLTPHSQAIETDNDTRDGLAVNIRILLAD